MLSCAHDHCTASATPALAAHHTHPALLPAPCPQSISIRESPDGQILVQGAGEEVAAGAEDLARLLALAACTRATGATMINECSSRSHAIFTIILEQHILHLGGTRASTPDPTDPSSGAGGWRGGPGSGGVLLGVTMLAADQMSCGERTDEVWDAVAGAVHYSMTRGGTCTPRTMTV